MKILVLGGTGAMGVDLVKILAKRGEEVTVPAVRRENQNLKMLNMFKSTPTIPHF